MNNMMMKQGLTGEQLAMVQAEMNKKQKSKGIAYALWWFTSIFGGHRFYSGNPGMGIAMLLTLGGCGIWALIDVFVIGKRIEQYNNELEVELIQTVKAMGNKGA